MIKNWKIAKKLTIGFGSLLGLVVVVGLLAFLGLNNAAVGFTEYREMARDTNLAGRLQANMLMVRMNVKDFIITGSDTDLQQYNDYLKKMKGFLEESQVEIQNPERARKIDLVDEKVKEYEAAFEKLIVMKRQRNEYVHEKLNVIGPEMERSLTKIMVSANEDNDIQAAYLAGMALRNLLLGRLYVIKFLDTNAQEDVDRVIKEFSEFKMQLTTLDKDLQNPERRTLLNKIIELEGTYLPTFKTLVDLIFERNELITGTLDQIGPIVAKNVEDVKLDIKSVQDTLGPRLVSSNRNSIVVIVIIVIIAIVIGIFLALYLTRSITKPLAKGVEFAKMVESGDLTSDVDIDQKDEVGLLVDAMRSMVANLKKMVDLAEQIADGNLTILVEARSEKDALAHALQAMVSNLSKTAAEIKSASSQVASGSEQLASASQSMSQGATEQASALEEISSSMSEIESQTRQNADNAKQANQFVAEVRSSADKGTQQMAEMVTAINEINESSQNISKIIKVIDEIAFQTNLLALNAAVEAARAGKYGKGFAVVAEEVRNLAARSATAAKETSTLIEGAVNKSEAGTEISQRTEAVLGEIVSSVVKVSDLVGEISAASIEQAEGVSQVSEGLEQIDKVTQQNSAHAEETASSSEELSSQATLLIQSVDAFRTSDSQNVQFTRQAGSSTHQPLLQDLNVRSDRATEHHEDNDINAPAEEFSSKPANRRTITLDDSDFGKYS